MDPGYFRYSRVICLVLEHERFEVKEDDAGRILAGVWEKESWRRRGGGEEKNNTNNKNNNNNNNIIIN